MFIRTCPDCIITETCIPLGYTDDHNTVYFQVTPSQDVIYLGTRRDLTPEVRPGVTYRCPQCGNGWNRPWAPWEHWALDLARLATIAAAGAAAWVLAPHTLWPAWAILTAVVACVVVSAVCSVAETILDPAEHPPGVV